MESLVEEAYSRVIAYQGDLEITFQNFTAHLDSIVAKEVQTNDDETKRRKLFTRLVAGDHITDLYLTAACALKGNLAWTRFLSLYRALIEKLAHSNCNTHQQARDVADEVIIHLFEPDPSGRSRIASYDGKSALGSWLASVVKRRAINHGELREEIRWANAVSLDSLRHTASVEATSRLEAVLLRSSYSKAIEGSFKAAANSLDERERQVLALLCDDDNTARDIARMFGLHPAHISRVGKKAELKFRTTAIECLSTHYKLSAKAITECLAEMLTDHQLSIVTLLRPSRSWLQLKLRSLAATREAA